MNKDDVAKLRAFAEKNGYDRMIAMCDHITDLHLRICAVEDAHKVQEMTVSTKKIAEWVDKIMRPVPFSVRDREELRDICEELFRKRIDKLE